MTTGENDTIIVYIGTYTEGNAAASEGVYVYRLDSKTGALTFDSVAKGVVNPSFLSISPGGAHLYAVNETTTFKGSPGGSATAFAVDPASGRISQINRQPTNGAGPCHISLDRTGRFALVANYNQGSVAVLPILPDGSLGPATDMIQHGGSGPDPRRQEGPHAHAVVMDPANRFALVTDLGIDKIILYRLDAGQGKLILHGETPVKPGAGPRHLAFHPTGRYVYLITELDCAVTAFSYDAEAGLLTGLSIVSTLPEDYSGDNCCAEVLVSPDGRFVYGSNRGHDSIAVFAIDEQTGIPTLAGHVPTGGRTPRHFTIDPAGRWLLAANQDSNSVVTFRINRQTGMLTPAGQEVEVPAPVCIKIFNSRSI